MIADPVVRVRGLIEKLIKSIEPSARLLSFGSSCNSFGLRNSGTSPFPFTRYFDSSVRMVLTTCVDMDLVVLIDDAAAGIESSHFVAMMGDLLERVHPSYFHVVYVHGLMVSGDKLRRQTTAKSPDTYSQAQPRSIARSTVR